MRKRKTYRCSRTLDWVDLHDFQEEAVNPKPKKKWEVVTPKRDVFLSLRESLIENGTFTREFFERADRRGEVALLREEGGKDDEGLLFVSNDVVRLQKKGGKHEKETT